MSSPNSLIPRFKFTSLHNTTHSGLRIILTGTISSQPALLILERSAFTSTDTSHLASLPRLLTHVTPLGENDIYHWYMANSLPDNALDQPTPPDLKINLIYPCTDKHLAKYAPQRLRSVTETPAVYAQWVRPYMARCREEGRLNWVFNILEGRSEQENVLFRSETGVLEDDYLLLPDLNWDRATASSLHLLALVVRRDIWSVRDLRKRHARWLRNLRSTLATTVARLYDGVEADMLKFYIHYQPTYYHFHIHIVNTMLEPTATQAVGKALGLEDVVSWLEGMEGDGEKGMADVELTYTLGEESELWGLVFRPLKEGREPEGVKVEGGGE